MEFLSIVEIWKYFRRVPKFFLKKLFTKERLADLVLIDVRARYEAVKVDLSEIPSYEIYFQIINMTPFEIELDRAEMDFICAGTRLSKQYIKKTTFKAGQVGSLYINGEITPPKATQISRHIDRNRSSISLHLEFNCSLHNFTKVINNLDGVNVHFINEEWRKSTLEKG